MDGRRPEWWAADRRLLSSEGKKEEAVSHVYACKRACVRESNVWETEKKEDGTWLKWEGI